MNKALWGTDEEFAEIYSRHVKTIYRVCFAHMKNTLDTEDVVQDTFIRLIKSGVVFESEEHEKAWLIRTASNLCKDHLRHWWRRCENVEKYENLHSSSGIEVDSLLAVVLALPRKYKASVYLFYYEGYSSEEIASVLHKPSSTIRNWLSEARAILREKLGGEFDHEE